MTAKIYGKEQLLLKRTKWQANLGERNNFCWVIYLLTQEPDTNIYRLSIVHKIQPSIHVPLLPAVKKRHLQRTKCMGFMVCFHCSAMPRQFYPTTSRNRPIFLFILIFILMILQPHCDASLCSAGHHSNPFTFDCRRLCGYLFKDLL